jgi:hypothetical protein
LYVKFKKDFDRKNLIDVGYDLNVNEDEDNKYKNNINNYAGNNNIKIGIKDEKKIEKKKKKCCKGY